MAGLLLMMFCIKPKYTGMKELNYEKDDENNISGYKIAVSNYLLTELKKNDSAITCFILYDDNSCKLITTAEYLLLKARKYTPKGGIFMFPNSEIRENYDANVYLSMAICGRYLSIYEQLVVIKHIAKLNEETYGKMNYEVLLKKERNMLLIPIKCFHMTNFPLFYDFLLKGKIAVLYLEKFIEDNSILEDFTVRWLYLNMDTPKIKEYWQRCLTVAKI